MRVGPAPALRCFTLGLGGQRHQGQLGLQACQHLGTGQHLLHAPTVGAANIHVFNEAQGNACAAKVACHGNDLVVVGAALHHHIHLDALQSGGLSGSNAIEYLGHREIDIVHAPESGIVQAVQTHSDALQPGSAQGAGFACQQGAIGGER